MALCKAVGLSSFASQCALLASAAYTGLSNTLHNHSDAYNESNTYTRDATATILVSTILGVITEGLLIAYFF